MRRMLAAPRTDSTTPPRGLDGPGRDRTCDLGIKSPLLYQLSYRPWIVGKAVEYPAWMGKGYAEGSAVEERLAALERGDDLHLQLDAGRTAVYGSTDDDPGDAFHRLARRRRPRRAVRLRRGVGHPHRAPDLDRSTYPSGGLSSVVIWPGLTDATRRTPTRYGPAPSFAAGSAIVAGAAPPRSAPRRATTGRPSALSSVTR